MKLFVKIGCNACEDIKESCNLNDVDVLDVKTVEGLALCAWFELVATAEKSLPILLITDKYEKIEEVITDKDEIIAKLGGTVSEHTEDCGESCVL